MDATENLARGDAGALKPQGPSGELRATEKIRRDKKKKRGFFEGVVRKAKQLNKTHSKVAQVSVFDNADFPWVADVERDWRLIRAELDRVLERQTELPAFHEVVGDFATITRDSYWKTYFFVGYGSRSQKNIDSCPQTWRVLQRIPNLKTAMFSILEPGKHLPAHKGPYNGVLRLHLGLIVPEPRERCAIRVDQRVCHWEEGKVLIFDDYFDHEAWNGTDKTRVVLFCDIVKPLRFPANLVNWLLLNLAPFSPFVREAQEKQKSWEQRFYRKN